ncbi:MAG: tetratricopeptide repeat protein [Hydrogenothermaceae bacterium]|nr:tetratricopeptide repeat protein [Hydrogenothermaceae bacterium]
MSQTGEFLKRTAKELADIEREGRVHPLSVMKRKNREKKKHFFIKFTLIVAYLFIIYAGYDLYNMKTDSYRILENFLNVEEVVKSVEKVLSQSVSLEDVRQRHIKSEEEIIEDIAKKSIKLPDLKNITSNIPPINLSFSSQQISVPEVILSRYDFFVKKGREYESAGNYRYAIFFYLRAFAEKQTDYTLKYKVASLYHQIGQEELALESAKEALSIKPDYLPALEFLIDVYSKTGKKPAGFIEILERARSYHQNNKDIKYTLAKLYKENGDYKAYEEIMASLKE